MERLTAYEWLQAENDKLRTEETVIMDRVLQRLVNILRYFVLYCSSNFFGSLGITVKVPRFGGEGGRTPAFTPKSGSSPRQIPESHFF